jgi:plastocyanin
MDRSSKRVGRRLLPGALLLAVSLAAAPTVFADLGINIAGFAFDPNPMTVHVGDTVSWTNSDGVGHTAIADDASFDTGRIAPGTTSSSVTFNTAGTFTYHCAIHSSMHGTIVVSDASTPPPTDTLDPAATASDRTPWALLGLAAVGGLLIGRRRFARSVPAPAPAND